MNYEIASLPRDDEPFGVIARERSDRSNLDPKHCFVSFDPAQDPRNDV